MSFLIEKNIKYAVEFDLKVARDVRVENYFFYFKNKVKYKFTILNKRMKSK